MPNGMNVHSLLALSALSIVACGGTSTEQPGLDSGGATHTLTCAIISGPNCWTEAIDVVQACAPGASVTGKLSLDAKSCTFPDGAEVTFSGHDVTNLDGNSSFGFELDRAGTPCVAFSHQTMTGDVRTLRTALGEASWTTGDTVRLSCPDGTVYETDELSALQCSGFTQADGFVTATGAGQFDFSLMAKASNVAVISCAQ